MYYLLSVISGILCTLMIAVNGEMGTYYGAYSSSVLIHIIGLTLISLLLLIKKQRLFPAGRLPFHLYLGGAAGVGTVVFCNLAFGRISVSAILALGLLGQTLTSLLVDQFGLFQMSRHPFSARKLPGIALVIIGISIMLWPFDVSLILPVIFALLSGVCIVVSRSFNARLALKAGMLQSTFFNYIVGLSVSVIVMLLLGADEPLLTQPFSLSPNVLIYTGGLMGVIVVTLLSAIVCKISALYATLLQFIGQVFSGILLDTLMSGSFSLLNLAGGIFVTGGMIASLFAERKTQQHTCSVPKAD